MIDETIDYIDVEKLEFAERDVLLRQIHRIGQALLDVTNDFSKWKNDRKWTVITDDGGFDGVVKDIKVQPCKVKVIRLVESVQKDTGHTYKDVFPSGKHFALVEWE